MARGNTQREGRVARSEARSPEALEVRSKMASKEGVTANEAIDKDPTLKAVIGNEGFLKELGKNIRLALESAAEDVTVDEDGSGTTYIAPNTIYFEIGSKTYALETPEIEVEWEADDDSFSYEYGSIKGTGGGVSAGYSGASHQDPDDILADSKIRLVGDAEKRQLTYGEPSDLPFGIPESKGLTIRSKYSDTEEYIKASRFLKRYPALGSVDLNKLDEYEKPTRSGGVKYTVGQYRYPSADAIKNAVLGYRAMEKFIKEQDEKHA